MSLASTLFTGFTKLATTEGDTATGHAALTWACEALAVSCSITMLVVAPWYVGWLLALIASLCVAVLALYLHGAVSDEAFNTVGRHVGSAAARVRNLFARKAIA